MGMPYPRGSWVWVSMGMGVGHTPGTHDPQIPMGIFPNTDAVLFIGPHTAFATHETPLL